MFQRENPQHWLWSRCRDTAKGSFQNPKGTASIEKYTVWREGQKLLRFVGEVYVGSQLLCSSIKRETGSYKEEVLVSPGRQSWSLPNTDTEAGQGTSCVQE